MKSKPLWIVVIVAVVGVTAGLAWILDRPRIVEGVARVAAPGILQIDGQWIHLIGLKPPREDPDCALNGLIYQCTVISLGKTAELVAAKVVRCETEQFSKDARLWGECTARAPGTAVDTEISVNRELVQNGWAMADSQYTDAYVADAEIAKRDKIGIWRGFFIEHSWRPKIYGGPSEIQDGNIIEVQEVRVHLFGIDAPDLAQTCTLNGIEYACGLLAHAYLTTLTAGRPMLCHVGEVDEDERPFGRCGRSDGVGRDFAAGAPVVNEQMVAAGWALANRDQTTDFVEAENDARSNKRGMWAGEFVAPAEWRRGAR